MRLSILYIMFFLSQILFASNDSLFNLIDKAIIEGKTSVAQKLIDENITRANNFQKANLLYLEGKLNAYQSNYSKAIECAYQSKKIALQNNFNEVVFKNDYLLGKTFQIIGDNNKAKEYFNQALSYPQDTLTKVKILYNLSLIETDSTKSFELIQKSVELLEYIDENTLFALEIQARFAYFKSDFKSYIDFYNKILNHQEANVFNLCQASNALGFVYQSKLNQLDSAEKYYALSVEYAQESKDVEVLKNTILNHINVLTLNQKYEQAASQQSIYNQSLTDSNVLSVEKYREIYEAERKFTQVQTSFFGLYLTIGMIVFVFLVVVIIYRKKQVKSQEKIEILQKEVSDNSKKPIKTEKTFFSNPKLDLKIKTNLVKFEQEKGFLQQDCTLKVLSEKFKLKNQKYLSDYIRKNLEKTFPQYLNELRINYTIEQFKTNPQFRNYSLDAVANDVGYKSKTSFLTAFKEKTGVFPQEFKDGLIS